MHLKRFKQYGRFANVNMRNEGLKVEYLFLKDGFVNLNL